MTENTCFLLLWSFRWLISANSLIWFSTVGSLISLPVDYTMINFLLSMLPQIDISWIFLRFIIYETCIFKFTEIDFSFMCSTTNVMRLFSHITKISEQFHVCYGMEQEWKHTLSQDWPIVYRNVKNTPLNLSITTYFTKYSRQELDGIKHGIRMWFWFFLIWTYIFYLYSPALVHWKCNDHTFFSCGRYGLAEYE